MRLYKTILVIAALPFTLMVKAQSISKDSLVAVANQAYIYGLPLVLSDLTRIGSNKPYNAFQHARVFPDHTFKLVVRPNNDTYYSTSFLDLTKQPVVLSIPDTKGRYAVLPLMDAWTNVFASYGKRTTGTTAQTIIITGPSFKGKLPSSTYTVKSPTNLVWIIGRIQVNNPEDGSTVVKNIQDGLTVETLSAYQKKSIDTTLAYTHYSIESSSLMQDLIAKKVNVVQALKQLDLSTYFNYLNELMINNPPLPADKNAIQKFATINVKPGATFNLSSFDDATQKALNEVAKQVFDSLLLARTNLGSNAQQKADKTTLGHYGTNYTKRAAVVYFGLGALVYLGYTADNDKQPLNGNSNYVIHFEPHQTPPAQAFWSITLYDKDGYLAANDIRRYAIGDRNKLKYNADSSLDIYVQHNNPGQDKEDNWLPAPTENFNLSVRIYWPTKEYSATGSWKQPPIIKQNN